MRFPKETRALILEAAPHPATIPWPPGSPQPHSGRLYWVQNAEDLEAEHKRREESPDTHAEVIAGMKRRAGLAVATKPKRRRRNTRAPLAGSQRIYVIATEPVGKTAWSAKVVVYEDPDPIRHLQIKTKVPAGPNPFTAEQEKVETEPEQLPTERSRIEEEDALRIEHKASVDRSTVMKAEQHLANLRKRGKTSKQAEQAVARAKKRAVLESAAGPV